MIDQIITSVSSLWARIVNKNDEMHDTSPQSTALPQTLYCGKRDKAHMFTKDESLHLRTLRMIERQHYSVVARNGNQEHLSVNPSGVIAFFMS